MEVEVEPEEGCKPFSNIVLGPAALTGEGIFTFAAHAHASRRPHPAVYPHVPRERHTPKFGEVFAAPTGKKIRLSSVRPILWWGVRPLSWPASSPPASPAAPSDGPSGLGGSILGRNWLPDPAPDLLENFLENFLRVRKYIRS